MRGKVKFICCQDNLVCGPYQTDMKTLFVHQLERRLTFIEHCLRSDQSLPQPITQILLCVPNTGGKHDNGRIMTYLKRILDDTQISTR